MFFSSEIINLSDMVIDPDNPRIHDRKNIDLIKKSLLKFGQYRPFIIQKSGRQIIVGNGMYKAMEELGFSQAGAIILDIDDTKARTLSILDNRSSDTSSFVDDELQNYLSSISEELLDITGFSIEELEELQTEPQNSYNQSSEKVHSMENSTKFSFGKISFNINSELFAEWQKELIEATSNITEEQKSEIATRLGLEAYDEN